MFQTTITNTYYYIRASESNRNRKWTGEFLLVGDFPGMVNREACEGKEKNEIIFYLFPASEHEERKKKKNKEESETGERERVSDERWEANLTFFKREGERKREMSTFATRETPDLVIE